LPTELFQQQHRVIGLDKFAALGLYSNPILVTFAFFQTRMSPYMLDLGKYKARLRFGTLKLRVEGVPTVSLLQGVGLF